MMSRDQYPGTGITTAILSAAAAVLMCPVAPGCAPTERPSLTSKDPRAQTEWIADAVTKKDWSAIPGLIELLDSSDPAERLVAIGALRSITGEDFGYRIADPPAIRGQAVDRWAAWWMKNDGSGNASDPGSGADTNP